MSEYIEKEALRQFLIRKDHYDKENGDEHFIFGIETVLEYAENLPAADVAPVVHGRWVLLDECSNEGVYCSACHKKVYKKCYANQKIKSKFCPNCGAKMLDG